MGIEKIGLPAKPAAKGSAWVVDASSCQTCQTPFSFFNRKHHCRRCGGLFCGNCSNSRVNLRGQADGPARVCEPCKKLEEAARFQARHRGKPSKVVSRGSSVTEEVLGDGTHSVLSGGSGLIGGEAVGLDGTAEVSPSKDKAVELKEENGSPEKLREQAIEQKKIYHNLKQEGKNAEALQAFKRHKELGREADALELSLKKLAISQRKALAEELASAGGPVQKSNNESPESAKEVDHQAAKLEKDASSAFTSVRKSSKDGDEDLLKSLKDLGWNDADLSEKKVKKGPTSDMELLAEVTDPVPRKVTSGNPVKQNPTQLEILGFKRQALALKREGKPAEAKEALKKAKLLEKKLEEMLLFGDEEDEDDDDELAALMRSLDKEAKIGKGKDRSLPATGSDIPLPFSLADDDNDPNVDVTDDDINDPSMIAALKSMGWVDEAAAMEKARASRTGGSEAFLMEAKIDKGKDRSLPATGSDIPLPFSLADDDNDSNVDVTDDDINDPSMLAALQSMGWVEEVAAMEQSRAPQVGGSAASLIGKSVAEQSSLQRDILSHKRRALTLKREGKGAEAKVVLQEARVLEQKLEILKSEPINPQQISSIATSRSKFSEGQKGTGTMRLEEILEDNDDGVEVDEEDMMDPEMMAALKAMGFEEEETVTPSSFDKNIEGDVSSRKGSALARKKEGKAVKAGEELRQAKVPEHKLQEMQVDLDANSLPLVSDQAYKTIKLSSKEQARKSQLQKELLAHKRRALVLKREGKVEEAKVELKQGKSLEKEMEEIESAALARSEELHKKPISNNKQSVPGLPTAVGDESEDDEDVTAADMHDPELLDALKAFGWNSQPEGTSPVTKDMLEAAGPRVDSHPLVADALGGATSTIQELEAAGPRVDTHPVVAETLGGATSTIQEEIKMHKRKALTLKKEGKQSEARDELRQSRLLEKQLEMGTLVVPEVHESPDSASKPSGIISSTRPVTVIETASPEARSRTTPSHAPTHKEQLRQEVRQGKDRMKLQQESLAHKRKALGLRREGKVDEAEAEFMFAKSLEKQMEDLDGGATAGQPVKGAGLELPDTGPVEDFLDPQLLAALKGLGWNDKDLHGGAGVSTPSLNKRSPQHNSDAGKSTTDGPASASAATSNEMIANGSTQRSHSRGGTSMAATTSAKNGQDGRVANRNSLDNSLTGGTSTAGRNTVGGPGSTSGSKAQAERKKLEDSIRQEKVKALELKRAGRHGEALELLRGAKRLEKQLLSMTS